MSMRRGNGPGRGPHGHGPGGMPAEKALTFWPSVRRLLHEMRPDLPRIVIVTVLAVVGVGLTVLGPKLLGNGTTLIFDGFLAKRQDPASGIDFSALGFLMLQVIGVYVFGAVFTWLQGRLLVYIIQKAMHRLRMQVEDKLHRLPLSYFDRIPPGELLSRVTNDVDNIGQTLQQTLSQVLVALLTVIGVLVMMVLISPLLALIALVLIPLSFILTRIIAKRSQKLFIQQWDATGKVNTRVEESFSGHALLKVFDRSKPAQEHFNEENERLYRATLGAQFIAGIIMPAMLFAGNLVYVGIAVVGGVQVAQGALPIGDIQAFIQYSRQFSQPLSQLGSIANLLQSGIASAERVFELLDAPDEPADPSLPATVPQSAGEVSFNQVSFRYTPEKPLIENLNLLAQPGATVAIVGPTGAGKTTLVNLLMRFYDITGGEILLNGTDITAMTRADLRGRTGMVLQDTWLFAGTIRENIAFGREGATEAEIIAAAEAARVDSFALSLPEGYDTQLDSEATNVSIGERQLITIARAFLANPRILILDEATSSVDTRTELLIQRAMVELRRDRTAFVIAHRLSTIKDADVIVVLEDGDIVEQGSHAELLARQGAYWRLYQAQFTEAMVEEDEDGSRIAESASTAPGS